MNSPSNTKSLQETKTPDFTEASEKYALQTSSRAYYKTRASYFYAGANHGFNEALKNIYALRDQNSYILKRVAELEDMNELLKKELKEKKGETF